MSSSNPQSESGPETTDGAQNVDQYGRLPRDEIADDLETQGAALAAGEYFPHGRGKSIHDYCEKLATALRADDGNVDIPAGRLLNAVTEALGDLELLPSHESTEALEHLHQLQFSIVEALHYSAGSLPEQ